MNKTTFGIVAIVLLAAMAQAEPSTPVNQKQARPSPDWLTRGVIYQVWLRTFTPEGTLKAAAERLPEVAELGATVIYLSPVQLQDDDPRPEFWSPRQQKSPNADPRNPYRVKDYDRIDPEYGTEADLKDFVAVAHKNGLRVLMDIVYHHTGPNCVLLEHPEFYQLDGDGKPKLNQWNFLRLDLQSSELREYFVRNMLHWVKACGIDGFRCDVSGAVPLDFWETARDRLEPVRPDLVILAEGVRAADQVKAFDVSYSFGWYNALRDVMADSKPAASLRSHWEKRHKEFPLGARFIRYTDNHDIYRSIALFGERGSQVASVLNFTLDGVPFIYNGQEIGDATPQDLYHHWPINWEAGGLPRGVTQRAFYKELCTLRRSEETLTGGEVVWLENDQPDSAATFFRRTSDKDVLVVLNLSNRTSTIRVNLPGSIQGAYTSLLAAGAKTERAAGDLVVTLQGFGYLVGKRD